MIKECLKNYKEFFISIFLSLVLLLVLNSINFYEHFELYQEALKNLSIYILSSLIGFLGIILAALGLFITIYDKNTRFQLYAKHNYNPVNKIFKHFFTLSIFSGLLIFFLLLIYIILYSNEPLVNKYFLYFIVLCFFFFICYLIVFTIDLIRISILSCDIVDKIEKKEQTKIATLKDLNSIRIEFLIKNYVDNNSLDKEHFLNKLNEFIDEYPLDKNEKEVLKNKLRVFYS